MQKPLSLSALRLMQRESPDQKPPSLTTVLLISAIGLLLVLPAILHGVFDAMDIPFHLRWTQQFSEQLWSGDFYPRWLYNMNAGLGSPAFFFYP
ncbi:hypothetical protein NC981_13175 [Leptolyngbya sp. DQ-M1]|uniref:hypothetical protein n=1 Tax=Leptolyngbya sp. DQ-M1 TaxID=2933920 RepID=UPI00329A1240